MANPQRFFENISTVGVAIICSLIQTWLLRHQLVDCLPFKVIDSSYATVGDIASWCGPICAVLLSLLIFKTMTGNANRWLVALAPSVVCPAVFMILYRLTTPTPEQSPFGPDLSTDEAWLTFHGWTQFTLVAGIVCTAALIGSIKAALVLKSRIFAPAGGR